MADDQTCVHDCVSADNETDDLDIISSIMDRHDLDACINESIFIIMNECNNSFSKAVDVVSDIVRNGVSSHCNQIASKPKTSNNMRSVTSKFLSSADYPSEVRSNMKMFWDAGDYQKVQEIAFEYDRMKDTL